MDWVSQWLWNCIWLQMYLKITGIHDIWKYLIVIPPWVTITHLWIRTYGSNFRASESKELIVYTCQSSSVSQSDKFRCHEYNWTELDRQAHSPRPATLTSGCEPSHFLLRQMDRGSLASGYSWCGCSSSPWKAAKTASHVLVISVSSCQCISHRIRVQTGSHMLKPKRTLGLT